MERYKELKKELQGIYQDLGRKLYEVDKILNKIIREEESEK